MIWARFLRKKELYFLAEPKNECHSKTGKEPKRAKKDKKRGEMK